MSSKHVCQGQSQGQGKVFADVALFKKMFTQDETLDVKRVFAGVGMAGKLCT